MKTCLFCLEDPARVDTCRPKLFLETSTRVYMPIAYGHPSEGWSRLRLIAPPRCAGCNVILGAIHHAGCRFERCPLCLPHNGRHNLSDGVHAALCSQVTPILRTDRPPGSVIYPARA